MIKTKTDLYYIVRYDDIYEDNKIWEVCSKEEDAEKHLKHIVESFKDDVRQVWIEYVKKTETKEIKLIRKVIM